MLADAGEQQAIPTYEEEDTCVPYDAGRCGRTTGHTYK
jgi:hypothetical protein